MAMSYSNLIGLLKHAQLMEKVSGLILQIQFSTAIEQLVGLNLGNGSGLWRTASRPLESSQIILKLCSDELHHIAR